MNRKEAKELLEAIGIEDPQKDQINSLLDKYNSDLVSAKNDVATEFENKALEGYVKKADYDKMFAELTEYRSKAKDQANRDALKDHIKAEYIDLALKDLNSESKTFADDLKAWKEKYPSLSIEAVQEESKPQSDPKPTTNAEKVDQQQVKQHIASINGTQSSQIIPQDQPMYSDELTSKYSWLK